MKNQSLHTVKCNSATLEQLKQQVPEKVQAGGIAVPFGSVKIVIDESVEAGKFKGYDVNGFVLGTYTL